MAIVLFEDQHHAAFHPLTFTRPVGDLRIGILTIREKWEKALGAAVISSSERTYLQLAELPNEETLWINARWIVEPSHVASVASLKVGESIFYGENLLACKTDSASFDRKITSPSELSSSPFLLEKITDIFSKNDQALRLDFDAVTSGRISQPLHESNTLIGPADQLFIEAGAQVWASTLNTSTGPIYIGVDAEVMEGSMVRGPFSLGEHSALKMGAKIYGAATIGPHCKIGGEVSNSVIIGFTNKAHDGFLGNSLLGEWCNLGADTNNSNLKNNYGPVKIWSYQAKKEVNTGLQFCGLIMGDHSKAGINTMFNTGTVVGVCANIFGGGFPPKHIPSFTWGGKDGFEDYSLDKAFETAERVVSRRGLSVTPQMRHLLTELNAMSAEDRASATSRQK